MKIIKIISALVIFSALVTFSASAEVEFTADCRYDSINRGFVVYGTTNDSRFGDSITIEAYHNGILFDSVVTETVKGNPKNRYESGLIGIDSSKTTGTVKFKIYSAEHPLTSVETEPYAYYGVDEVYRILNDLALEMGDGDFSGIRNVLNEKKTQVHPHNYEILGVNYSRIAAIKEESGATIGAFAKTVNINLPENADTLENRRLIFEKANEFKKAYLNMILLGDFAGLSSKEDFLNWYEEYKEILDLNTYNQKLYTYFSNNYQKDDFSNILFSSIRNYSEINKVKDRLLEVAGLTSVKIGNTTAVSNVFADYASQLSITLASNSAQNLVIYGKLAGQKFVTLQQLSNKYNELSAPSAQNEGVRQDSGLYIPIGKTDVPVADEQIFTDLKDAKWAEDAVLKLYDKKIVVGNSESLFMPNKLVTRAEFVKMLIVAHSGDVGATKQVFCDVQPSAWYFDYVNKAYELGFVFGDENRNFNPNKHITREDMAAMIYRVIGNNAVMGDINVFNDAEDVSDYAIPAVAYLNANGIIYGMTDGNFAPKSNATRAQAAQIIYGMIR